MPSINDTLVKNLDLSGYGEAATPSDLPKPTFQQGLEPIRNSMIRCPLPPIWQANPDSLRQFYVGGKVPQVRFLSPLNPLNQSTSSTSSSTSSSGGGTPSGGGSGGGSSSGGSPSTASQVVVKTQAIAPGSAFIGSTQIAKGFQLLSVSANAAVRIELYGTAAIQAQDLGRALDVPPSAGTTQNIICDLALDTSPYQWTFQNRVGANADNPQSSTVYITLTNIGAGTTSFTVTLHFVALES